MSCAASPPRLSAAETNLYFSFIAAFSLKSARLLGSYKNSSFLFFNTEKTCKNANISPEKPFPTEKTCQPTTGSCVGLVRREKEERCLKASGHDGCSESSGEETPSARLQRMPEMSGIPWERLQRRSVAGLQGAAQEKTLVCVCVRHEPRVGSTLWKGRHISTTCSHLSDLVWPPVFCRKRSF